MATISHVCTDNETELVEKYCALKVGPVITHKIVNFPVISVEIRQIIFKFETETRLYDGFIKDVPGLVNCIYPTTICVQRNCDDLFLAEVIQFYHDDTVCIIWYSVLLLLII